MTDEGVAHLRQEIRDLFYHGFDNYIEHAFPEDELRPLSCAPLTRDRQNPAHIEVNDVLGNYSLTLVDSLSTLAILASSPSSQQGPNRALEDFQDGIALLVEQYGDGTPGPAGQGRRARGFDLDSKVQVFETTIRGVGGLLSAHLFATGELPIRGYVPVTEDKGGRSGIPWHNGFVYDGQLLRLAQDLAERLLPAFRTETGIPYPRVNLRTGIPFYANCLLSNDAENAQCPATPSAGAEITETCSAGAGSLVLEFSTLSRLTGDGRFERAAKEAFWAIWHRRSTIGLIGSGIDAETGHWVTPYTGIGAGIDSFFEYALKSHILLSGLPYDPKDHDTHDPLAFLTAWQEAHAAIKRHIYRSSVYQHPHYIQTDVYTGAIRAFWVDSLSAYYPGLLTLAGELDEATEAHLLYTALWTRYSALPERWSTTIGNIEAGLRWWGGRPEFIESTWYLYRATQDPWYLHIGEMVLKDIKRRCWTECGWAGLQDVRSGEQSDRMESFFLGETAKYLFLLFDPDHPLNTMDAPFVFTTEGHPLIVPRQKRPGNRTKEPSPDHAFARTLVPDPEPICPSPPANLPFSISATAARNDIFHAASLARLHLLPAKENLDTSHVDLDVDHPSIGSPNLGSPSNYTYYPWTLPPELVPHNATSAKMVTRTTFDLSFPNLPDKVVNVGALQRVGDGILVNSISGLRLEMVREPLLTTGASSGGDIANLFRIHAVSNVALGRDEKVFMAKDLVSGINPVDPYFTRIRDMQMIDLVVDVDPTAIVQHRSDALGDGDNSVVNSTAPLMALPDELDFPVADKNDPSLLSSLLQNIQNIITENLSMTLAPQATAPASLVRSHMSAILPTGPGAAPLPDLDDCPALDVQGKQSPLPWRTMYISDETCKKKLPASVPREHQIIVVKRGGCSFSQKLQNIPAFAPTSRSLQLVVVVSYAEQDDPEYVSEQQGNRNRQGKRKQRAGGPSIQPLLDQPQLTPGGITRHHPIPMVMVGGGEETLILLRRSKGVGIKRRWLFMSQGLMIENLVIL